MTSFVEEMVTFGVRRSLPLARFELARLAIVAGADPTGTAARPWSEMQAELEASFGDVMDVSIVRKVFG